MDYVREYKSFINSHNLNGAIRITAGITLPAILLGHFNNLSAGIAVSIGAMCVGNTDNPGPIHHRKNGMIACVIIIFVAALLTGLVSMSHTLTGILVFSFCFIFSMMSIYGNRASSIGVNALLVMVLNIDRPHVGWDIVVNALYILAGGTWYTLLSLLLYSFRPYKLIQQALGDCIQSTAGYLRIKASFYDRHADLDKSYRQLVSHQIELHEKQELLRELLFKSRDIVKESTHIGRVLVMIFLDIVDLFEKVMTSQQDYRQMQQHFGDTGLLEKYQQVILAMAVELDEIGIAVKSGKPSVETSKLASRIRALREAFYAYRDLHRTAENVEDYIGLRDILESIEDIGDRLHTLHGYTTYDRKLSKNFDPELDYEQFISHQDINKELLVENLSIKSNVFRHSLRVSIATIAGYAISGFLPFGHGYWILLTIIVIMKPAYSLTQKRNYERLVGTLAGALTGLLILYFIKDRHVLFVLMILFMIGTYVFIRTNYLVCVTLMTPYVLILFHLILNTGDFRAILLDRVIDTALGSAIAWLAIMFLLPTHEGQQIVDYMIRILEANAAYFRDVAGGFTGRPAGVEQYKLSRKNAFVALANLSDAFSRILSEPRSKREHADRMHQFVVSNHMLTSHIATLSYYSLTEAKDHGDPQLYAPVVAEIGDRLDKTVNCLEAGEKAKQEGSAGASGGAVVTNVNPDAPLAHPSPLLPALAKEGLRALNDQMNRLVDQRKSELGKGEVDSPTRRRLADFKPIVDQFNFIAKVTANIERLSNELQTPESIRPPAVQQ